ncbi:D-isomer specific 2-hydroxyacid dehydrogenase [Plectosphaerella cucumerina]|uniref:D-isomer specific 2-hydroxyacid dehydrogenase n=1 Tax=Plectosphaerella cucumerina TaxID=40658 RepID=A0A8K0TDS1_9PEZI|nr:D-isomer specific 2-hydroxyacid dehydrogenase [Plectosphaerella cucumerina]
MAPSRIEPDQSSDNVHIPTKKPTMYLLEIFPEDAIRHCQTLFHTILPTDAEVHNWRDNADAILVREKTISASDIASARRLKAIGKQGTGIDIIDKPACDARGIRICNTPGVNAQSVAELVLALTMGVARQLRSISVRQENGIEIRKEHCSGSMLTGTTIGVIGMGAIGSAVARMFQGAFGCAVMAYDPFAPVGAWSDIRHTRVSRFEDMLPVVDMLTLHVPLNEATSGMIGVKELAAMKESAILINVARGGIVDETALLGALERRELWGAGLDCHEEEPPTLERYGALWKTGRVISTPHVGATTRETVVKTATAAMDNVHRFLREESGH